MNTNKIAIVTDSSAHIPPGALQGLDVSIIPVWLFWDGDQLRDGVDIDSPTFYRRLKASKTLPTSSQPSPSEFTALYKQLSQTHTAIVNVLVSDKISGTIASARAAQETFGDFPIHIVDSFSSSMGLGLVVLATARAAAAGEPVEKVVAIAEELRHRIHFLFVVDTLEYLHRGGRIKGAKRLMGTALQIKPILHFQDGLIQPLAQARTQQKAIALMLKIAAERLEDKKISEAAVADIDCPETGDAVAQKVKQRFGTDVVYRAGVSPVVGTHVGPGTVGFAFYTE